MDRTFEQAGYKVIRGVLEPSFLERLRSYTDHRLAQEKDDHFDAFKYHGSMMPLDAAREPVARRLVVSPPTLAALDWLGFAGTRWLSGYIISKPAFSPSLWWHQDWWAWDEPVSFARRPAQVFVMYYLTEVDERNGALRVIPGSHRRRHRLHDVLPEAHSKEFAIASANGTAHRRQPGEVTVSVAAGDAVVGDCRLLHATHANASDERRTCLTLWYLPAFDELPESIRSYLIQHPSLPPAGWWRDGGRGVPAELRRILPTYDGDAVPAAYNRQPPSVWPS